MPRFAANISTMYGDVPFPERFAAAARDGFKAVECQFPYEWPAQELAARMRDAGLRMVLMNGPPGGVDRESITAAMAAGTRGLSCLPGRERELEQGFALALQYAQAFDCPRIHLMAGIAPDGADRAALRSTLVANVRTAARMAASAGRDVVVEPINTRDIPGFFLNRQDEAHAIVQESGAANAKVQMDLYHCQIVEGDLAQNIRRYLPTGRVGHFQIAGNPARNEPDEGEVDYGYLCGVIDEVAAQCGWDGWIGAEYKPKRNSEPGGTSAGLGWLKRWERR